MTDSNSPKKILILDDEADVRTYLATLLQDNGYQAITANDGQEGFEKLKSERPDLVTLDITMPEKSGIRFYRDLRDDPELADIPVVVVTGVTGYGRSSDDFKRFLSTRKQVAPPEGFIAKPIDQEVLLSTIRELLG